jgi:peptidoglycan/LPS O-acetylase OafA/YrhL
MKQSNNKTFLLGLNEIRALAALGVLIGHAGIGPTSLAPNMVTIFFVLSGFLISFLLLQEKDRTENVDIKKFYIRRTLRIWPLYFTYIFIIILIFGWSNSLWYYIFFAGNLAPLLAFSAPLLGHFWSLGVEEQFYSFWPWIAKYAKSFVYAMLAVLAVYFSLKIGFYLIYGGMSGAYAFIYMSKFQSMAIGGLFAYLFYHQHHWVTRIINPKIELLTYLVFALMMVFEHKIPSIIHPELFSILVAFILIQQVSDNSLFKLRNKTLDFIGTISFGIYVYHPLVLHGLHSFELFKESIFLAAIATIVITTPIAYFSFHILEKPFLNYKHKFSV